MKDFVLKQFYNVNYSNIAGVDTSKSDKHGRPVLFVRGFKTDYIPLSYYSGNNPRETMTFYKGDTLYEKYGVGFIKTTGVIYDYSYPHHAKLRGKIKRAAYARLKEAVKNEEQNILLIDFLSTEDVSKTVTPTGNVETTLTSLLYDWDLPKVTNGCTQTDGLNFRL